MTNFHKHLAPFFRARCLQQLVALESQQQQHGALAFASRACCMEMKLRVFFNFHPKANLSRDDFMIIPASVHRHV